MDRWSDGVSPRHHQLPAPAPLPALRPPRARKCPGLRGWVLGFHAVCIVVHQSRGFKAGGRGSAARVQEGRRAPIKGGRLGQAGRQGTDWMESTAGQVAGSRGRRQAALRLAIAVGGERELWGEGNERERYTATGAISGRPGRVIGW